MSHRSSRIDGALLDIAGAAEYLGLTPSALRHQIERGRVPALRLGGRVFLRRQALDQHLERLEREWVKARGRERDARR